MKLFNVMLGYKTHPDYINLLGLSIWSRYSKGLFQGSSYNLVYLTLSNRKNVKAVSKLKDLETSH